MGRPVKMILVVWVALLIGVSFTLFVFFTLDITWIVGIALLTPGFTIASTMSAVPMLVVNCLLYAAVAFLPVWLLSAVVKPPTFRRLAWGATVALPLLVVGGRALDRELDRRGHGMCGNDVVQEVISPDRRHKAVVFTRDCGALGDVSTQLSLVDASSEISHADVGNVFVAEGLVTIRVEWESPRTLAIEYPGSTKTDLQVAASRGIAVKYHSAP